MFDALPLVLKAGIPELGRWVGRYLESGMLEFR